MKKKIITPGSWKNKVVCSDLAEERAKADFDSEGGRAFKNVVDKEHTAIREEHMEFLCSDPILCNSHKFYDSTREEMWADHMKKFARAWELRKHKYFVNQKAGAPLWSYFMLGQNMSILNQTMFLLSLENMCTDE